METETVTQTGTTEGTEEKKGLSGGMKLVIFLAIALVLLGIAGLIIYWFVNSQGPNPNDIVPLLSPDKSSGGVFP